MIITTRRPTLSNSLMNPTLPEGKTKTFIAVTKRSDFLFHAHVILYSSPKLIFQGYVWRTRIPPLAMVKCTSLIRKPQWFIFLVSRVLLLKNALKSHKIKLLLIISLGKMITISWSVVRQPTILNVWNRVNYIALSLIRNFVFYLSLAGKYKIFC